MPEPIPMADARTYPTRPFLAVSAAILRDGQVLLVRRARRRRMGCSACPAAWSRSARRSPRRSTREVREETGLAIEPVALAGYREVIARDGDDKVERHFVILLFAARWVSGEPLLNEELSEARWVDPAEIAGLPTTPGLAEIVAAALARLEEAE